MRRRELLATLGASVAATAGCQTVTNLTGTTTPVEEPVTVETLDAPGSEAGTVTVPATERVTFVELFATTCHVCAAQMSVLREVHRTAPDDVQFLSVTSEPVGLTVSREEVAEWWADHDGTWTVGVDDGTALARRYDATSVPTAAVVRPDGTLAWAHSGRVDAETILTAIADARDGQQ